MKTAMLDLALEDIDGVVRWYEYIRGELMFCSFDARLLGRVLKAKAITQQEPQPHRGSRA